MQNSGETPRQRDPVLQSVLEKAGAYAKEYRKLCRELVAQEKLIQKEYDKKGRLKNQRLFISDYLVVTLPSDPESTVEFRDISPSMAKPLSEKIKGCWNFSEKNLPILSRRRRESPERVLSAISGERDTPTW